MAKKQKVRRHFKPSIGKVVDQYTRAFPYRDVKGAAAWSNYKPQTLMPGEERKQQYEESLILERGMSDLIDQYDVVYPDFNNDSWEQEFQTDIDEVKQAFRDGKITAEEAEAKFKEVAEDFSSRVEDDLIEGYTSVTYYNPWIAPETIHIGTYRAVDLGAGGFIGEDELEWNTGWEKTDAWRGYGTIEPKDPKKWVRIHSDTVLAMSEDADNLERFDRNIRKVLSDQGVSVARAVCPTSNMFAAEYDMFVNAESFRNKTPAQIKRIFKDLETLKKDFRDPEKFAITAFTGANPDQATKQDRLFVGAATRLLKGESLSSVKKRIEDSEK